MEQMYTKKEIIKQMFKIGIPVAAQNLISVLVNMLDTLMIGSVGEAQLLVGNFIQAIISFLLTALVLFFILKAFNSFKKKEEEKPAAPAEPPAPPADVQLLTEIRDLLKNK